MSSAIVTLRAFVERAPLRGFAWSCFAVGAVVGWLLAGPATALALLVWWLALVQAAHLLTGASRWLAVNGFDTDAFVRDFFARVSGKRATSPCFVWTVFAASVTLVLVLYGLAAASIWTVQLLAVSRAMYLLVRLAHWVLYRRLAFWTTRKAEAEARLAATMSRVAESEAHG